MHSRKWGLLLAGLGLSASLLGVDGAFILVVIGCVIALPI